MKVSTRGVVAISICGIFDLIISKVIWDHSVHLSQMACNWKTASRRTKRSEIRVPEVIVDRIVDTFSSVKSHFGVIRCTYLKVAFNSKTALVVRNKMKYGTRG